MFCSFGFTMFHPLAKVPGSERRTNSPPKAMLTMLKTPCWKMRKALNLPGA